MKIEPIDGTNKNVDESDPEALAVTVMQILDQMEAFPNLVLQTRNHSATVLGLMGTYGLIERFENVEGTDCAFLTKKGAQLQMALKDSIVCRQAFLKQFLSGGKFEDAVSAALKIIGVYHS